MTSSRTATSICIAARLRVNWAHLSLQNRQISLRKRKENSYFEGIQFMKKKTFWRYFNQIFNYFLSGLSQKYRGKWRLRPIWHRAYQTGLTEHIPLYRQILYVLVTTNQRYSSISVNVWKSAPAPVMLQWCGDWRTSDVMLGCTK